MSCCRSNAAVDVIDHEADSESQTIILGTGRSSHPQPRPVVNQGSETSIFVNFVSATAQVDFPDEELPEKVRKRISTESQVSATEIVWKPQGSSGTNTNDTLITAQDELNRDVSESRAGSDVADSCLLSASKGAVNVIPWNDRLFCNKDSATCGSYFPVIVNVENGKLFAFNNNQWSCQEHESHGKHSEWLAMPGIGFLPNDVMDIIAGDGGLLCVNGGSQPRKRNLHTPPIPHADDYNHMLYPQQSILVVCNPVTEELKFLPRHTNKKLDDKIACLQILKGNGPSNLSEKQVSKSRLRYRVHVVGGHHERSSLRGPASDELVLMTYDSRSDTWISGMAVGRSRIPAFAKTGIARQEEGFYLGGQEESEEVMAVKNRDTNRTKLGNKRMNCSRGQFQAAVAAGGGRSYSPVWTNKIFYVQASTLKWHSVDFEILGEDGLPHPEPLQAPRVVQCRTGGPV